MIKHLKTPKSTLLEETKLLNLDKVNVICGRNNSGKTTLLSIIEKDKNVQIGKKINEDGLEFLVSTWDEKANKWQFRAGDYTFKFGDFISGIGIKDVFNKLVNYRNVWFSDETQLFEEKFWELFVEHIHNLKSSRYISTLPDNKIIKLQSYLETGYIQKSWKQIISNIFNEILTSDFFSFTEVSSILVSPKRLISEKNTIVKVDAVSDTGRNLISKLFGLKTKNPGSDAHNFYNRIHDAFIKVSGDYEFHIQNEGDNNDLNLFFSFVGKNKWIDAKSCGLGLQDLLIILYFALESENFLILLEEPENHLHPEMQRKLLRFLAEETNKQFFITTHSNIFVNSTYVDRVFFTKFENGKITVYDETKQAEMLHDLGYSVTDNLVSDLIILVEGVTDVPIIEEFFSKLQIDEKYNVKTWALGGDIMDKHNLEVFVERYKVMALIDKDPKSDKVRKKFIANCENLEIPVKRLKKYAIENYFSVRALKKVFKSQIPDEVEKIDSNKKLFDQIGIDVKNNNRKLAREMSLKEIEGTDLMDFFDEVKTTLQNL